MQDAVVVVGGGVNGLGVLRSLGRAGMPIVLLDTDLSEPTQKSRYGRKIRAEALSGEPLIDTLLGLRPQFDRPPVLMLTQEASVETVSNERERLKEHFRFSMPPQNVMAALQHKIGFQDLAAGLNFPVPRAMRINRSTDWPALRELQFPCVFKPVTKSAEYGARFKKAYKVASADEVESLWKDIATVVDEMIVQEWIEGGDSDVYFCLQYRDATGRRRASFVGRKMCQWPPLVGGTASCIPAPEVTDELTALTDAFFDAVGFIGIGSMEYKRDPRDGRFYMVEPTVGRTDYQEEIASLNGVNIPLAAYYAETGSGDIPQFRRQAKPAAWRDPFGYARARASGSPDPMDLVAPGIKVFDAYWRLDDPMPGVALKLASLLGRFSRLRKSSGDG